MGYERDKDRHTRGVGAIAALDHGNAARLRYRQMKRRRSEALDRARREYTYQPGGGLGAVEALGRVNLSGVKPLANHTGIAADIKAAGGQVQPPPFIGGASGGGGLSNRPTTKLQPSRLYGGAGTVLQNPQMNTKVVVSRQPTVFQPTFPMPLPVTPTTGLPPARSSSTGGSLVSGGGGGGGGTWGAGSGTVPAYPGMETPELPDIPADEAPATDGVDIKTVAIVGGVAVAAWFLFFRNKKGTP
jgi:hypothetical protein